MTHRLVERFRAAEATTGAPDKISALTGKSFETVLVDRHGRFQSVFTFYDGYLKHIRRLPDNTLCQAETNGKILQRRWRYHHDDMRAFVIGQGDRHFRCNLVIMAVMDTVFFQLMTGTWREIDTIYPGPCPEMPFAAG